MHRRVRRVRGPAGPPNALREARAQRAAAAELVLLTRAAGVCRDAADRKFACREACQVAFSTACDRVRPGCR